MSADDLDVLARILDGELSENSPEARALFEQDPKARERLVELQELEGLLFAESEDVAAAAAWSVDREAAEVTESEPRAAAPTRSIDHRQPRPLRLVLTIVSIAAALMLLFQIVGTNEAPSRVGEGIMMGSGVIEVTPTSPVGVGNETYIFAYETGEQGPLIAEVRVWSADVPEDMLESTEPLLVQRFEGPSWTPTPAEMESLPDAIRWTLRVENQSGKPLWGGLIKRAER